MGLSFSVYQKELSSKGFIRAYEAVRVECPELFPFADHGDLIAFFHDQTADLDRKDAILYDLITRYRNDNRHRDIAPLFIVLFTPVFASIYAYSRRGHPGINREDLIQDICLLFIQIIKESAIIPYKVAGQIAGKLRNRVRILVNLASDEEFVEIKGDRTDAFETDGTCAADSEDGDIERIVTEITAFLDRLVRTRKITRKDKRILLENLIGGKSLRDMASPRDYDRLKHRRRQVMDLIKKIFCK